MNHAYRIHINIQVDTYIETTPSLHIVKAIKEPIKFGIYVINSDLGIKLSISYGTYF